MHDDCDSRSSLLSNRSLSTLIPSSLSCPPHLRLVSTSRVARICSWCGLQIIIFFVSIRKVIHFTEKKPDSYCNKFTFVVCAVLHLVAQSNLTLCDPMDYSPAGSPVHGNSPGNNTGVRCHASPRGPSQPRDRTQVSRIVGRFFILWAIAQTHMNNIFSKKKYKYKKFSSWKIVITLGLCLLKASNFYSQLFIKIAVKSKFLLVLVLTTMPTSSL